MSNIILGKACEFRSLSIGDIFVTKGDKRVKTKILSQSSQGCEVNFEYADGRTNGYHPLTIVRRVRYREGCKTQIEEYEERLASLRIKLSELKDTIAFEYYGTVYYLMHQCQGVYHAVGRGYHYISTFTGEEFVTPAESPVYRKAKR